MYLKYGYRVAHSGGTLWGLDEPRMPGPGVACIAQAKGRHGARWLRYVTRIWKVGGSSPGVDTLRSQLLGPWARPLTLHPFQFSAILKNLTVLSTKAAENSDLI